MNLIPNEAYLSLNCDLTCCVCLEVINDPVSAPCNAQHIFCRVCLLSWTQTQQTCPIDRQPIAATNIRNAPLIVRNMLSELRVRCTMIRNGERCAWEGKKAEYQQHSNNCPFAVRIASCKFNFSCLKNSTKRFHSLIIAASISFLNSPLLLKTLKSRNPNIARSLI